MTDPHSQIVELGTRARKAAQALAQSDRATRDRALRLAAERLRTSGDAILTANEQDMAAARTAGKPDAFLDRLALNPARLEGMAEALEIVADLPDPLGRVLAVAEPSNGLRIERVAVPIGVIAMVFEARPNVASDAGGLCVKSGNAVILRGGSDSFHSSSAITECLRAGLVEAGLPADAVQMVPTGDREAVRELLRATDYVDLAIPRGGRGLVELVRDEARVPTLLHLDGNCHSYIHAAANLATAIPVVHNAKMRRTGVCGATESVLIDRAIAAQAVPALADALAAECELRGDAKACALDSRLVAANPDDWDSEYLDAIASIKLVEDIDEAIDWINTHGSHHTDAILTEDAGAAVRFLNEVDSAIVIHNASTQFADGGEFGMGAEIGIATGRMHARGPVGLEQLTTFKYRVHGKGQSRA